MKGLGYVIVAGICCLSPLLDANSRYEVQYETVEAVPNFKLTTIGRL
jgi:hypothetical protein